MGSHIKRSASIALVLAVIVLGSSADQVHQVRQAPAPPPPLPTHPECNLTTNPDISGIGVRVAFYMQGLLAIFAPLVFTGPETESFFRNSFLTSISLIFSTFIYGRTPGALSVVDGLLVTFLPFIINAGTHNHTQTLMRAKKSLRLLYVFEVLFSSAFSIYVWINVGTYGSTPGCNVNSTAKFVVFGHAVLATNKGLRIFAILFFSFTLALTPSALYALFVSPITDNVIDDTKFVKFVSWAWMLLLMGNLLYGIVTVEQILRLNNVTNIANRWTYGQTLAMALLLGPAFDLISALWRKSRELGWVHSRHP